MLKCLGLAVWGFILVAVLPAGLAAQNFVYTNNDQTTANSVSAFSVDTDGALSEIEGSPFATDGVGTASTTSSPNRIIVVKGSQADFLYASNAGSNTISAFTIHSDGTLGQVGSPISTEGLMAPHRAFRWLPRRTASTFLPEPQASIQQIFRLEPLRFSASTRPTLFIWASFLWWVLFLPVGR